MTEEQQERERKRLFEILERLVKWENSNDKSVLAEARAEIEKCFPDGPPPVLDPFGGGGAIPLEAQRLGLQALSGDLNPVAVLIQKAMIEIPPRFDGQGPVHPDLRSELQTWERAQGLADDVEAYGEWMRAETESEIGHLYPRADGTRGEQLTPIAWLWARTVESPDPAWRGHVPLVGSWVLSKKPRQPKVWIEPQVDPASQTITYSIRQGGSPTGEGTVDRGGARCIATGASIPFKYIREQGKAGKLGRTLLAVVVDTDEGRRYLPASPDQVEAADVSIELSLGQIPNNPRDFKTPNYGMGRWEDLFTQRQLIALTTYEVQLRRVHDRVVQDALAAGLNDDGVPLRDGGKGAEAYADAVSTYLAFGISRLTDMCNALCRWESSRTQVRNLFGRQAIAMLWDYAENNVFNDAGGDFRTSLRSIANAIRRLPAGSAGYTAQRDARARVRESGGAVISTDPPYYDNISYADLSDFFFVWLRRSLSSIWPDECATLSTPKADEMIANPYRAGSKAAAQLHFESGMAEFMEEVASSHPAGVPATIYYAYKATETTDGEIRSTGWDTFLQGVLDAGMQVTATWPMRTELSNRLLASKTNALASSIVLSCRPRAASATLATRGEFIGALRQELPGAVRVLQSGNIAPVDLAQSTIGPGIKVFSRYAKVVEADGSPMSVSDALAIINDVLGEVLDGEEAELDRDTRFAVTWYAQHGYNPGNAGDADAQSRAKNTSLSGIESAGIGEARSGKFRLFERSELAQDWDPGDDDRLTVWEATQHLVSALERSETDAAHLLHRMGGYGDRARQLAYVLFQKATDRGWAEEAGAYNGLITAWPSLQAIGGSDQDQQTLL